ncbi:hypothetical protein Thermo_00750 [Thermoplasmatales archaeon]|nr:hypothetical protein Thermo_00750 [Thermoplasmatales archaeon]
METEMITTTLEAAKRLTINKQFLSGNAPDGSFNNKLKTIIRNTGYIQWDPVTVVAPSHLISIWSRIGKFDHSDLDNMMWKDKEALFHWSPTAWIVLTEDYPIFYSLMKRYPDSMRRGWTSHIESAKKILESNNGLKQRVISRLKAGPAETGHFRGYGNIEKSQDGWSSGNEVSQLLFHLHMTGEVMVVGHSANQNVWALTDDFLPEWADRTIFPIEELEKRTAIRALKALGVAPELDIYRYFVRGRYTNLKGVLKQLVEDGIVVKIRIEEQANAKPHYLLSDDKRSLDSIMSDKWEARLNLISPFDNMITLRERAQRMFNFDYILEQFLPKEKRKFGTYVLPILWDCNLVGRLDAKFDRDKETLNIKGVFAEPKFHKDTIIGINLHKKVEEFAEFLGAEKILYGKEKPEKWAKYLN